jgi:hypothetical protein
VQPARRDGDRNPYEGTSCQLVTAPLAVSYLHAVCCPPEASAAPASKTLIRAREAATYSPNPKLAVRATGWAGRARARGRSRRKLRAKAHIIKRKRKCFLATAHACYRQLDRSDFLVPWFGSGVRGFSLLCTPWPWPQPVGLLHQLVVGRSYVSGDPSTPVHACYSVFRFSAA